MIAISVAPLHDKRRREFVAGLCIAFSVSKAFSADSIGVATIAGDVKVPLTLQVAMLREFPASAQVTFTSSREVDGTKTESVVRGVRLRSLLEQAGLAERDRLDWRKTVVIAWARDGYRVVFSWPELVNTDAGQQVMVAYERDHHLLDDNEGPMAIFAPGDIRAGARHVKWLSRVEIMVLRN